MKYIITAEAVAIAIKKGWYVDTFRTLIGREMEIDLGKERIYDLDGVSCILFDTDLLEGIEDIGELYMPTDALSEPKSSKYEMSFLEKIEEENEKRKFKKMISKKVRKIESTDEC